MPPRGYYPRGQFMSSDLFCDFSWPSRNEGADHISQGPHLTHGEHSQPRCEQCAYRVLIAELPDAPWRDADFDRRIPQSDLFSLCGHARHLSDVGN